MVSAFVYLSTWTFDWPQRAVDSSNSVQRLRCSAVYQVVPRSLNDTWRTPRTTFSQCFLLPHMVCWVSERSQSRFCHLRHRQRHVNFLRGSCTTSWDFLVDVPFWDFIRRTKHTWFEAKLHFGATRLFIWISRSVRFLGLVCRTEATTIEIS